MALQDILAAIEQETRSKLDAIHRESADRQAEVRRLAESRAEAEEARFARSRDAELERFRAERLARAEATADRALRTARERVFTAALERTRAQLEGCREDSSYPDLLRSLIAEGRTALPTATRIEVDPRDVDRATRIAPDLEVQGVGEGWAGVVLVDDAGRRVDNALHTRLAVALPELRGLVGRELAGLWSRP